jgi:hypothetical protein
MEGMALRSRAGWIALAGFVAVGCAHARTQQVDAPLQPAPSPVTPPTVVAEPANAAPVVAPVAPTPAIAPVASATPPAATVPAAVASVAALPPGSGADAAAAMPAAAATTAAAADFAHDVRPILEKRCQPCHFEGGKMYERLPFDRAETIQRLGARLFTRIKAEDEQAVIRRFLAQGS